MIELLVALLIIILVFGAIWYALTLFPLPHPFSAFAQLIVVILFVLCIVFYVLLPLTRMGFRP